MDCATRYNVPAGALVQVVGLAVGGVCQALVAGVANDDEGAFARLAYSRPRARGAACRHLTSPHSRNVAVFRLSIHKQPGLPRGRILWPAALEKSIDLPEALETFGSERHAHPPMIPDTEPPSGSYVIGRGYGFA